MPHALADVVRAGAGTCFDGALAGELDPRVLLQVPDALGEEARGDEVQEACGDDEEDLKGSRVAAFVDEVADQHAGA